MKPVRLVVLNYNGGAEVLRCVQHLLDVDWPADELEVVVIDNASTDGSLEQIQRRFPSVRTIGLPTNDGFPANNLALRDLGAVRYVGLVNNDAFVEPDYLRPLVETLDADPTLGAASPLMVFERQFVDITLETTAARAGRGDPRALGVMVSGLRVDGDDAWRSAQLASGGYGAETSSATSASGGRYEWTSERAVVRIPVVRGASLPGTVQIRLSAIGAKRVTVTSGSTQTQLAVDDTPAWLTVGLDGVPYDLVNNAGSVVAPDGYGADRGFGEPVEEWRAGPDGDGRDVFAWCGGAVLLRPSYLADVGLFDERFFLYYEDTDLSWRGQARGWRYRYVPSAVVRHLHAASSIEGSERFAFCTERNRLLMLFKNAPRSVVLGALWAFKRQTYDALRRDVLTAVVRRRRPNVVPVRRRLRALVGFAWMAPRLAWARARIRREQTVSDADLAARLAGEEPAP